MQILISIISFVVLVGFLVLVHELGHFIAARRAGVSVDEFGFGFPPRLASIKRKNTTYSLNWIPLGGFVKIKGIAGDDEKAAEHARAKDSFTHQSFSRRFIILFAGIGMNFFLTWVLLTAVYALGFHSSVTGKPMITTIAHGDVRIEETLDGSLAETAGIQAGDILISINGQPATSIEQAQAEIKASQSQVHIDLLRNNQPLRVDVPTPSAEDSSGVIGVGLSMSYPLWVAPWLGLRETIKLVGQIFVGLYQLIAGFTHGQVSEGVMGPVGIAAISGQVVGLGLVYILFFAALLSANLAIFNLLPLPALDGGRIIFLLIERIQGKPMNQKMESLVHALGFASLLGLALLITVRDVLHLLH